MTFDFVSPTTQQCVKIDYFLLFFALFIWRTIDSQYYILMSDFGKHIYRPSYLAIAHQEKIATLIGVNGYNSQK